MTILHIILAVAFAAYLLWLTVFIVNGKEPRTESGSCASTSNLSSPRRIAVVASGAVLAGLLVVAFCTETAVHAALAAFLAFCFWLTILVIVRGDRLGKCIAVGLLLVVGYPLSIGPVVWLNSRDLLPPVSGAILEFAYWPLERIDVLSPPLHDAVGQYAASWCPAWPDRP